MAGYGSDDEVVQQGGYGENDTPVDAPAPEPEHGYWVDAAKSVYSGGQQTIGGLAKTLAPERASDTMLVAPEDIPRNNIPFDKNDPDFWKHAQMTHAIRDTPEEIKRSVNAINTFGVDELRAGNSYKPQHLTGSFAQGAVPIVAGPAAPLLMGNTAKRTSEQEMLDNDVDPVTASRVSNKEGLITGVFGAIPYGKYLFGEGTKLLAKSVAASGGRAFAAGAGQKLIGDKVASDDLLASGYDTLGAARAPELSGKYLSELAESGAGMLGFHTGMQVGGRMMSRQPLVGLAPQHLVGEETGGAAPHDPSSEQATIDLTPPAPLEMEHTAINPYDVGGHVSELQQNRPMTVDNTQADLFGGTNEAPPVEQAAPVQPKPEDLVTPQQRAETFAKYQGVPVVHGTTETGTRFGGKIYNHAPGADPLSNEKLTAEVNRTAAAEAAYPEDRTALEHAIIGAAHESGVVRPGEMKPAFVAKTIKDLNLEGATTSELAAHFVQNHLEELQGKKGKTNQEKIGFYQALLTRLPDVSNERKGVENGTDNKPQSTSSQDAQATQQQDVGTLRQGGEQPDRQAGGPLERVADSTGADAAKEKIATLVDTLPAQQKALYNLVSDAANNRALDSFVNADGTWQYQKIADATGMTRQAAYKAVQDLKPKFNALFGGDVKAALAARTKAVRTNEGSDYDRLGESPAHQASVVDHAEITGGEDRPGMQGMGVIDRVNRSQSGEQDVRPHDYKDSVEPNDLAKGAALATRMKHFEEVARDYDESTMEGDIAFKDLPHELQERYTDEVFEPLMDNAISAKEAARKFSEIADEAKQRQNDARAVDAREEPRGLPGDGETGAGTKRLEEQSRGPSKDAGVQERGAETKGRTNPIEQRVAELRDRLSDEPVLAKRLDKFIQRYRDGDWDLNRFKDELDTLEQAPRGAKAEPVDRRDPAAEERRQRYLEMTPEELRLEIAARDRRERTSYLTGLDNRVAYDESPKMKVTASADIDGMKAVNDHLGHAAGDSLIKAKADALKWAAKSEPGVRIYHQSGDEFIAQANSHEEIDRVMNAARDKLMNEGFKYTAPDGSIQTKKGVGFSYGKGDTYEIADRKLHDDKAARKAAGLRSGERDTPAPGDRGKTAGVGSREGAQDAGHDTRAAEDVSGRRADAEATARKVEHIANEHPAFLEETKVPAKGIGEGGREEDIHASAREAVSALKDDVSYLKKFLDCVK